MKSSPRGFTLIELLVVIAIIAILAAILFPVFAQAKAAAKKAVTISNAKQIGTSLVLYSGDADDVVPIGWYFTGLPYDDNRSDILVWSRAMMPYLKSIEIFRSPNNGTDLSTAWSPRFGVGWKSIFTDWGFNTYNLNPARRNGGGTCPEWYGSDPPYFLGQNAARTVSLTEIANPADTVYAAETNAYKFLGNSLGSHIAIAPVGGNDPELCNWPKGGWGKNSDWETLADGGKVPQGLHSANVAFRNTGQNSTLFTDSHVKSMPPGALAAGTDWSYNGDNLVSIVDQARYLWDIK